MGEKIEVENINTPGRVTRVDAQKYAAMKQALFAILPKKAPGFTQKDMVDAVKAHLPQDLFPQGKTAGWWVKTVQLDQEAKGAIVRQQTKPLRWHLK